MKTKGGYILLSVIMALALGMLGGCTKAEEGTSVSSSAQESRIEESTAQEETAAASDSVAEEESNTAATEASTIPEEAESASSAAEEETTEETAEAVPGEESDSTEEIPEDVQEMVASSEEYATKDEVGSADMVAVTADELTEGTYEIEVDSSSSMFRIVHCDLVVADGGMTANVTMSGKGYLYIYPGTAVEAAMDTEDSYIGFTEDAEGAHVHLGFPVEALNAEVDCAAFSKRKEKWYDRTLVFLADSLPAEAYAEN